MTSTSQNSDTRSRTLETSWVVGVGSYFSVDFDETLCEDGGDFTFIQRILETIPEEKNQWE